jgi:pimeloyl-ACP methyl ester carboxylesterase
MFQTLAYRNGDKIIHLLQQYNRDRYSNAEKYTNSLISINIPLTYISGFDDTISGENVGNEFKLRIKNPRVILIKDVGHWPQLEDPNTYLNEIFKFLDNLSK